jgi:hypothetical protein
MSNFFDKALTVMSEEIAESDRACDFCINNHSHLLVCNRECQKGVYEFLSKQAEKC